MVQADLPPSGLSIRPRLALFAGGASICTVIILILVKGAAYLHSNSASVLASLVDSLSDAGVSVMSFLAIHYSLRPADSNHRYGHGKAEGLAALMQAAFIGGAGVFLLFESLTRFTEAHELHSHNFVVTVMAISTALSVALVLLQKYSLNHAPSLAVEADKAHYNADIVINIGVMGVMVALGHGAPGWIDPVFAIAVAFWLAFTVRNVAGKGLDMLLDRELPDSVRLAITQKVLAQKDVLGMHDLRTNKSGMKIFISFDIEVDPHQSLQEAHEVTRAVEKALLSDFPLAEIMIKVDPHGDTEDSRHQVSGVHH